MPRKIRQLKADLLKAGFYWRPGKDEDVAQGYQERQVKAAIQEMRKQK